VYTQAGTSQSKKRRTLSATQTPTQPPEQVTPELAAQIVKNYVLPMFEKHRSQGKGLVYSELKLNSILGEQLSKVQQAFQAL
jgi:hypothetical protein